MQKQEKEKDGTARGHSPITGTRAELEEERADQALSATQEQAAEALTAAVAEIMTVGDQLAKARSFSRRGAAAAAAAAAPSVPAAAAVATNPAESMDGDEEDLE